MLKPLAKKLHQIVLRRRRAHDQNIFRREVAATIEAALAGLKWSYKDDPESCEYLVSSVQPLDDEQNPKYYSLEVTVYEAPYPATATKLLLHEFLQVFEAVGEISFPDHND